MKQIVSILIFGLWILIGAKAQPVKSLKTSSLNESKITKVVQQKINITPGKKERRFHIDDTNFAQALHKKYPNCIDEKDSLLPAAGLIDILDLQDQNIKNLSGVQGFSNLKKLNVNENRINELSPLPNSLQILDVGMNDLTSLPQLPEHLLVLDCSLRNQFASLPDLPQHLTELSCYGNSIHRLPILPAGLQSLNCKFNNIEILPKLPEKLTYLDCTQNDIKHIPNIPSSLRDLYCDVDKIDNAPLSSKVITVKDAAYNYRNATPGNTQPKTEEKKYTIPIRLKYIYVIQRVYIEYYDLYGNYHAPKDQMLFYVFDADASWSHDDIIAKLDRKIARGLNEVKGYNDVNEWLLLCENRDCTPLYELAKKTALKENYKEKIEAIQNISIDQ